MLTVFSPAFDVQSGTPTYPATADLALLLEVLCQVMVALSHIEQAAASWGMNFRGFHHCIKSSWSALHSWKLTPVYFETENVGRRFFGICVSCVCLCKFSKGALFQWEWITSADSLVLRLQWLLLDVCNHYKVLWLINRFIQCTRRTRIFGGLILYLFAQ